MHPDTRDCDGTMASRSRAEEDDGNDTNTMIRILMILHYTNTHTYTKKYIAFVSANGSTRLDSAWIHRWIFRNVDEVFGKWMEEGGVLCFLKGKSCRENLRFTQELEIRGIHIK